MDISRCMCLRYIPSFKAFMLKMCSDSKQYFLSASQQVDNFCLFFSTPRLFVCFCFQFPVWSNFTQSKSTKNRRKKKPYLAYCYYCTLHLSVTHFSLLAFGTRGVKQNAGGKLVSQNKGDGQHRQWKHLGIMKVWWISTTEKSCSIKVEHSPELLSGVTSEV